MMRDILANQVPTGLQIISTPEDYYPDHGIGHIERIISKLEMLDQFLIEPINEIEAFVLLVAVYFHDISMFLGRKESEDPEQTRKEHHTRSAEIVQWLNDNHHLNIDELELRIIKRIIEAHRVIDLQDLPEDQRIHGTKIRTRLLGGLLRIADACDCDSSRAPKAIFDLFYEHIPEKSRQYWEKHFPVTDVSFNALRASIVISIDLNSNPEDRIERYRMVNMLKKKLESELRSVENVFSYNTISLARVELKDFNSGVFLDFSSPPTQENHEIVALCSDSKKISNLINITTRFISNASDGILLIIELRPPEGPLFIDTRMHIERNKLDEIETSLQETLGSDLWGVKSEIAEKTQIRRGVVT